MHTASDRDHMHGARSEDRTVELCVSRARFCLKLAREGNATMRGRAREWIALGKARRAADRRKKASR